MFEKKRGKRFLASIMALVMLLSLAPVGALATEGEGQPAENQTVTQPANGVDQKPVETGTANTNEETTPPPANEGIAVLPANNNDAPVALPETPVIVKPTEVLDQAVGVDSDTSKDNGIADYKGGPGGPGGNPGEPVDQPEAVTSITAEYWVTNSKVTAGGKNSLTIDATDSRIVSETGASVESLAPGSGTQNGNVAVFWQARVLSNDEQQTTVNDVDRTADGKKIQAVRYYDSSFWYQEDSADQWTKFATERGNIQEQLVFYYLIKTDFEKNISVYVTDWPLMDSSSIPGDAPSPHQVNYEVWELSSADAELASATKLGETVSTYYNKAFTISAIKVGMNENQQYYIQSITIDSTRGSYNAPSVDSSEAEFSLNLKTAGEDWNLSSNGVITIKIYVTAYKYELAYEKNGGTINDSSYPQAGYYLPGTSITAPTNVTKTGYTFAGWYTDEACTDANEWNNGNMPSQKLTLYAKWNKNSYTVTYKDGDTQSNGVDTVEYNSLVTVRTGLTKEGHIFNGWKSDADNTTYSSGQTFTMPAQDVTLTAVWKDNTTSPTDPDTDLVDAMYFVLMPGQGVPNSGVSQGVDKYFPNASNNGGVTGKSNTTGYEGKITKAATELTGANTSNGYFDVNGVGDQYLKDIGDLGYFNAKNYNADGTYKGTLPTGMANFNMTNKSIVWYVIKKEGDVYHVDGYVKGVNIELKYFDEFNGQQIGETTSLLSGNTATIKALPSEVTHDGWRFAGWFTKDGTKYEEGKTYTLIDSLNLYARWTTTYDVVTHFMDANGVQTDERTKSNLSGVHGTLLKDMVLPLNQVDTSITGNYVYVPSETKYSIGNRDQVPVGTTTFTTANTVIHQYYYLDETGKTDEKGKDTNEPNNYPDAWEYKATFIVKNGQWDANPTGGSDTIVKYLPTKNIKTGESIPAKLSNVPTAGNTPDSHYKAGSWDQKPNEDGVITEDMTYTYTYSWRSSGGSGGSNRPKPPVVEIPDDVPTGLNGKDHYAYIIGYGNNDVRPQNNITRAEVATIFFRLLTDETREANMTKSNSYNDVKDGDWFCCAVSTLSKMGIIKGYEDGSFKPNDPISRAEFAAIAARFDPDGDKTPASFFDVTSHWAKDEISIAANHGWIKGYEDGSFKPDQKITRAETMTLVNRVLNRLPETKDDLHKDMKTWVDNMDETAWYYLAVQEATNSHYFKNKTGTKFEQWTDLRDTRDWSELEK